jgi:hypothetical protein
MTYWVLTKPGHLIARSTVQHITITDMATEAIRDGVSTLDTTLLTRLSDNNFHIKHLNPVFYLQGDIDALDNAVDHIMAATEYKDMTQSVQSRIEAWNSIPLINT